MEDGAGGAEGTAMIEDLGKEAQVLLEKLKAGLCACCVDSGSGRRGWPGSSRCDLDHSGIL